MDRRQHGRGAGRAVLEQHEFGLTTLHNAEVSRHAARQLRRHHLPRSESERDRERRQRPEHPAGVSRRHRRRGIAAIKEFVAAAARSSRSAPSDLAIERLGVPLKNLKSGLTRDQHFAPGTILRIEVDTANPVGYGMKASTTGFYNNSPFFSQVEGFSSHRLPWSRAIRIRAWWRPVASRRGVDGGPCRRRVGRHESRTDRAVRAAAAAPRADARDVPMLFNALYLASAAP